MTDRCAHCREGFDDRAGGISVFASDGSASVDFHWHCWQASAYVVARYLPVVGIVTCSGALIMSDRRAT